MVTERLLVITVYQTSPKVLRCHNPSQLRQLNTFHALTALEKQFSLSLPHHMELVPVSPTKVKNIPGEVKMKSHNHYYFPLD